MTPLGIARSFCISESLYGDWLSVVQIMSLKEAFKPLPTDMEKLTHDQVDLFLC